MAASAKLPVASAAQARKRATPSTKSATGRVARKKPRTSRQPLPSVTAQERARVSALVADRGRREDQLQAHGDVDAGDHQERHQEQAESGALGLGPGLGRSARGHQQQGQWDDADHESQDDGEHEIADDPRIDRGEPGG